MYKIMLLGVKGEASLSLGDFEAGTVTAVDGNAAGHDCLFRMRRCGRKISRSAVSRDFLL